MKKLFLVLSVLVVVLLAVIILKTAYFLPCSIKVKLLHFPFLGLKVPGTYQRPLLIRPFQIYPDAIIVPTLLVVGTDSREYTRLSKNIYNFAPIVVDSEDLARLHGLDERIKIKDFTQGISFYYQLIRNSN